MPLVQIMVRHPISGDPTCYDGKVHTFNGNTLGVQEVGSFVTRKTGVTFCYQPGYSRVEEDRVYLFPKRYTTGVHCMWLEPVAG